MTKSGVGGRTSPIRRGISAAILIGLFSWSGCGPDVGPSLAPGAGAGVRSKGADTTPSKGTPVDDTGIKKGRGRKAAE